MRLQNIFALSILLQFFKESDFSLWSVEIDFSLSKALEQDEMLINPRKNDKVGLYVDASGMIVFWSLLLIAESQLCPMNDDK